MQYQLDDAVALMASIVKAKQHWLETVEKCAATVANTKRP